PVRNPVSERAMASKTPHVEPRKAGLPRDANKPAPDGSYPPYIEPHRQNPEPSIQPTTPETVIAIVFGAANAYLGLRAGLTVSASIPAAVMAIVLFRALGRGTVLETNIVQTIGSAGESVAAGVIFTIPALFIWQQTDPAIRVDL